MRRRFLIVHNPNAGRGRRQLTCRVARSLEQTGCRAEIREAICAETGRILAAEAAASGNYDAIVAAGGDGTIRSVAAGLRGSDVPVGVVPLGTGNVMAHEIGLPRRADAIAAYLREGVAMPVVGGLANGSTFLLMAGVGLDAEAVAALDMRLKRRIGKLAYVWPVLRAVLRPAPDIRAVLDGEAHSARWIVVCNASRYAGGFTLSPDSHVFEPGLTAVICTARSTLGLVAAMAMIGAGYARQSRHLRFVRFRRGYMSADKRVRVQVDGESFGALPLTISEDRTAVHLLVPAETARSVQVTAPQAAA